MSSSSPGSGSKLSRLRRRIAKTSMPRLKFLRHSNSRAAASSPSYSDRLASVIQSAEDYPDLKALAGIVNVLYSNVNRSNGSKKRALSRIILFSDRRFVDQRSVEILEAVFNAIPDPSQISPEMHTEISDLTTLFRNINRCFDPMRTKMPRILRSQLDTAYSKFVPGKKPRTLKALRIFRGVSVASVADISITTLQVIGRASDAFPPLKSVVGGALALLDVTQGANASKLRARQLGQQISNILEKLPPGSDGYTELESLLITKRTLSAGPSLRHELDKLELSRQSFFMRFKNLNRDKEFLSTAQTDFEHVMRKIMLTRAFPPESAQFRTRILYVMIFSASLVSFDFCPSITRYSATDLRFGLLDQP
ncbi:hypothetical protein K435DRAFT_836847 [Dendrothele bispora CBS 962.96]|uniref:Fungal STAND N-terminal Goodbye domain-containing protein n=1 Tax=Dendrothele bispora (strain CBS 962.96) TaxID=1314807 RepID=A0A4S8MFN5_DENBC|nr:hypothetical protein K435DRAFT_836847 [Dendrothele bispora CBS 962.96]